ncbi:MAG: ABC transporter substrate-binding protein [Alphaproteobacteria bacterium]|nr:ABC transporter substrate-binding protein [Alphaproteobacteria bacterium]
MRGLLITLLIALGITGVYAQTIELFGREELGYNIPKYSKIDNRAKIDLKIYAIADADNFPISSQKQGSVFSKIFNETLRNKGIDISLVYNAETYDKIVQNFERNEHKNKINAHFGVYYQETPYSKNKYIFPAFFVNEIHVFTSLQNSVEIEKKSDLKKYKGIHPATDKVSNFIKKEFEEYGIKEVESFSKAFEELLTGQTDYIVASYYPGAIELYKTGIKDYVSISQEAVWKMPMFIRVDPNVMHNKKIKELEKILKSEEYKKQQIEAFEELLEIYRENTRGIVPPKYVKPEDEQTETKS